MPSNPEARATTLHGRLFDVAAATPDELALVFGDRRFTFAELAGRVRRAAHVVANEAAGGGRIAAVGANCPAWIDLYYGVPAAGGLLTMLNHRLAGAEMVDQLARSGASLLVGDEASLEKVRQESGDLPPMLTFTEWEDALASAPEREDLAGEGPAWLIFTSGTTARPKGAVLSHKGVLAAIDVTNETRPMVGDTLYVFSFPLCHIAGYNVLLNQLRGRAVALLDRFTADAFVDAVQDNQATSASLAATMLHDLLDHLESTGTVDRLKSLRTLTYGAAPMPTALLRRAHAMLGLDFWQGYGSTELSGNAVFLPPDAHERGLAGDERFIGVAGWPARGVELRIVDASGTTRDPGESGEILVRAAQVFEGYWDDPAVTAATIVDGWLHTGDVGILDETGLLRIVDRLKDVIVTGGENVSSLEVEEAIRASGGVRDVAVVGIPDVRWGEAVCAVVVPEPGTPLDRDRIVADVRARLAGFKVPRRILERSDLPKNATGKVVKADLRLWASEAVASDTA